MSDAAAKTTITTTAAAVAAAAVATKITASCGGDFYKITKPL